MNTPLPDNHQSVMPYLILNNAASFLSFAQHVFGAKLLSSHGRDDGEGIMHAEVNISGITIMFADSTPDWAAATGGFFIYVTDADAAYHEALKHGAKSVMELADKPYGRTCGVEDPTGNTWWITSLNS